MPVSPTLGFGSGGPGGSRVVTLYSWPPAPPFLRAFPASARVTVCTSRRPERQIHTPAPDPVAPVRPDTTSQQHMHTVANCTPIPPRFTPHQKCWAVKITRFSPKVAPHSRMTAQSGDWCRFELSSEEARDRDLPGAEDARDRDLPVAEDARDRDLPGADSSCRAADSARTPMHGHSPRTSHTSPKRCPACSTPPLRSPSQRVPHLPLLCSWQVLPALCLPSRVARTSRLLDPRAPDGCPCTLTRSARCPNPSLPVCRRCGSLTATIIGARCDAHATPHYGSSSDKSGGSYG